MKQLLIVITILLTYSNFAQTDDVLAKSYYSKAEKEFESKNYSTSIEMLDKTTEYLKGNTFSKVEYLYVMNHYKMRNYEKANLHMKKYFDLNPSESSSMYSEIVSIIAEIKEKKLREIEEKRKKRISNLKKAYNFSEGLGIIRLNGKYGFVNNTGDIVIPVMYDYVRSFKNGRANVKLNKKFGFIDKNNNIRVPIIYSGTSEFNNNNNYAIVSTGETILRLDHPTISTERNGIVDKNGKIVVPIKYKDIFSIKKKMEQLIKQEKYLKAKQSKVTISNSSSKMVPKKELANWVKQGNNLQATKDAANNGKAYAQRRLDRIYNYVYKDKIKGLYWRKKAANNGDAIAQSNLGYDYHYGESGLQQNYKEAAKWYRKSALQGHKFGQHNLGVMFENGFGVTKDYYIAEIWYRKAAKQGYMYAQNNLGLFYEDGKGVTKNQEEAIKWYRKAANQGLQNAKDNLKRLGVD